MNVQNVGTTCYAKQLNKDNIWFQLSSCEVAFWGLRQKFSECILSGTGCKTPACHKTVLQIYSGMNNAIIQPSLLKKSEYNNTAAH